MQCCCAMRTCNPRTEEHKDPEDTSSTKCSVAAMSKGHVQLSCTCILRVRSTESIDLCRRFEDSWVDLRPLARYKGRPVSSHHSTYQGQPVSSLACRFCTLLISKENLTCNLCLGAQARTRNSLWGQWCVLESRVRIFLTNVWAVMYFWVVLRPHTTFLRGIDVLMGGV